MGLWKPSPGSVVFRGQDITGMHTADIARLGIALVPENMGIFGGLTVEENLVLATASGKFDAARLDMVQTLFPALRTFWTKQAWSLSGGQKQMLAVARAIIEPRALILIDEPTKGWRRPSWTPWPMPSARSRRPPRSCWWNRTSTSPGLSGATWP